MAALDQVFNVHGYGSYRTVAQIGRNFTVRRAVFVYPHESPDVLQDFGLLFCRADCLVHVTDYTALSLSMQTYHIQKTNVDFRILFVYN